MNLEKLDSYVGVNLGPTTTLPAKSPKIELETVGNVNRLMTKRDWIFWSGSTAGGLGITGAMLGLVTVNPILMAAGGAVLIAGSISMIGATLFHYFSKKDCIRLLDSPSKVID